MKKLLFNKYKFYKDTSNEKYIFENVKSDKLIRLFLLVIETYKPPIHVNPIFIYEYSNLDDYNKGLIYVGYDKNNYLQYFYGKEYVNNRNIKRDNIIKKMVKNITKYTNIIKDFLKKKDVTLFNFACILLLELNFFIRTGKSEYETVGLLTLKNKNIKQKNNHIEISFIGKKQVDHKFILSSNNSIYKYIQQIINNNKNKSKNDHFFNISESAFYNIMQENFDGVRLKDFRTYGVNKIFVENLKNIKEVDVTNATKKTISKVLEDTAEMIGHSKGICKSSYLSKYLYDMICKLDKDELIRLIKDLKKTDDALDYVFFKLDNNKLSA
jgi:DNA topoisomerase IB